MAGPAEYNFKPDGISPAKRDHELRKIIRFGICTLEAARRPKDFQGTQFGVNRLLLRDSREKITATSLYSGGQWTGIRAFHANLSDGICTRCSAGVLETLTHRLWECSGNIPHLDFSLQLVLAFGP